MIVDCEVLQGRFYKGKELQSSLEWEGQCFCFVTKRRRCSSDAEFGRQPFNDVRKYSNLPPCQQYPGKYLALQPLDPHTIVWSICVCCILQTTNSFLELEPRNQYIYEYIVSGFVLVSSVVSFDLCTILSILTYRLSNNIKLYFSDNF